MYYTIMTPSDPIRDRIAAVLTELDVQKIRGRYTIVEHRGGRAVARLKPIPDTDRFELFYWSFARDRWTTFGPLGPMRLEINDVVDILRHDPMFRIKRKGFLASLFD